MKRGNKGFTLVELLVMISIIGILAVVAVPSLFKNIEKAKLSELEADISALRSAFLAYYADSSSTGGQIQGFIKKENNKVEVVGNKEDKDYLLLSDIIKEIDDLSMPFEGLYIIQKQGVGQNEQQEGSQNEAIYDTYLYIKPKDGTVFSDNVINKLKIDLKDIIVKKYTNKNQICVILMKDSVY